VPVVGEPLYTMPGQAPNLRALPPGCAFAARCAFAQPHHAVERPPWREAGETQRFLCHLPEGAPEP
jgi:oligopeptide/dipeptide ABC transporter ATP-binding protein